MPHEARLELISRLADQMRLQTAPVSSQKHRVSEFRGTAQNLMEGMDAQIWVNQLRDEWNDRDVHLRSYCPDLFG
ncbi:hypothetical protein ACQ4M3_19590 [Leptolyngbya sp. AN03gr2]|uniref:hypothetical protein n=1 Tax=unclassified Leptolyngbya TaxID=2650499 RepID=UPI003D31DB17